MYNYLRAKPIEHLEENIGVHFCDLGLGNGLLHMTLKAMDKKEKDKLDFVKIRNFYASKDTIKKVKRQLTEWEEIFTNHTPDKGIVFRIYKEPLQFSNRKTTRLAEKKMGKGSE